jgi:hypothetical protein
MTDLASLVAKSRCFRFDNLPGSLSMHVIDISRVENVTRYRFRFSGSVEAASRAFLDLKQRVTDANQMVHGVSGNRNRFPATFSTRDIYELHAWTTILEEYRQLGENKI